MSSELQDEIEALTARVRRLEARLDQLEPETAPGIGRERPAFDDDQPSESPILDAIGDVIGAFGGFDRERG